MATCGGRDEVLRAVVSFWVYGGYVREQVAAGTWGVGRVVVLDILYQTGGSFAWTQILSDRRDSSCKKLVDSGLADIPDLCTDDIGLVSSELGASLWATERIRDAHRGKEPVR